MEHLEAVVEAVMVIPHRGPSEVGRIELRDELTEKGFLAECRPTLAPNGQELGLSVFGSDARRKLGDRCRLLVDDLSKDMLENFECIK